MPKLSDHQLSVDEEEDIIAYIKNAKETPTQGGWGLDNVGPVTEGPAMWTADIVALVTAALRIGSRRRTITRTRSIALRSCQG